MGGRPPGSANKTNRNLREAIARHADGYYTEVLAEVTIKLPGSDQLKTLFYVTQFEADLLAMEPKERAQLMERYISYILPKLQSNSLDMEVRSTPTIEDILTKLATPKGEEL